RKKSGLKRKIPIERRETNAQRSVTCNKRRKTIFSKSADLCRLGGANIAVFVTSPAESSDVVYSFSGYSSASEIADCYFNDKPPPKKFDPQAKVGFLWEDPNLYRNCDDLSELNIIEDRLERLKKYIMECLENKEKLELGSLDEITCGSDQKPNVSIDQIYGNASSSSQVNQNPNFSLDHIYGEPSSSQVDQNPNFSLDYIYGEPSSSQVDENPSSSVDQSGLSYLEKSCDFVNGSGFGFTDGFWERKEENNSMSLTQETETETMGNVYEDSFWDNQFKDNVFGLNNYNLQDMLDIGEFFYEEDIELLHSNQFAA
ncbi:Transcription factor MADS-box, partial [Arabidopsis thaliana x Arabidopsis arenosa]